MIESPINIIVTFENDIKYIGVFYYDELVYKHTDRKYISKFLKEKFGNPLYRGFYYEKS